MRVYIEKTILLLLVGIITHLTTFSDMSSCLEISGTAGLGKFKSEERADRDYPFGKQELKVFSPAHVLLANSATENDGSFSVEVFGADDYEWLYLEIGEETNRLYAIFNEEDGAMADSVTSSIVEAMLRMKMQMESISNEEMRFVQKALYEAARTIESLYSKNNFKSAQELFSNEEYRLLLGDMLLSFSTPGNTLEEYGKLKELMREGISLFSKYELESLSFSMTEDAEIEFDGQTASKDQIFDVLLSFRNKYEVLKWDVSCARITINEDSAEVETTEKIALKDLADGSVTDNINMNFRNLFVKKDNQWKLYQRRMKKCEPERALIFADGSSADWTGIRPCVSKFVSKSGSKGEKAELNSIYLAHNDRSIFWRLENSNNLIKENFVASSAVPIDESIHILFVLTILDTMDGEPDEGVYSWTGVKAGKPYSLNEARTTALDGFKEKIKYLPDNFHVGTSYAEGTISKQEIKGLKKKAYLNARIILDRGEGKNEVLSEGVPIEFVIPESFMR